MNACVGRDVPLEVMEKGLKDEDWDVRSAAMKACVGRDVPLEVIEKGLTDEDLSVRTAAMNACAGRDVPLEVIEKGLKDKACDVRKAAVNASGRERPLLQTFEPPETVYKKCLNDVIVCATIPKDAQVRGNFGQKCRANKAIITDVIGDFYGEPVGFSIYDSSVYYYKGDEVIIEDFDMSDEECSTGFHFFCTREEAKNY
jgi:hypothetical protein